MRTFESITTFGVYSVLLFFCTTAFGNDLTFEAAIAAAETTSPPEVKPDLQKLAFASPDAAVEILANLQQGGETEYAALGLLHRTPYVVERTCSIIKHASNQAILPYAYQALADASKIRGKMSSEQILRLRNIRMELSKIIEHLTGKAPEMKLDPTLREVEEFTLKLQNGNPRVDLSPSVEKTPSVRVTDQDGATTDSQSGSLGLPQPPSNAPIANSAPSFPHAQQTASALGSRIVILIVAAPGLLWLFLKGRK